MVSTKSGSALSKLAHLLGLTGGILAAVGIVSCVIMLVLELSTDESPDIFTHLAALCIPFAFVLLFVSLALLIVQRRRS